ncbi:MAG TPA: HD-GYP domain-containing protein [Nitrospirae bacterium]|nr:HD-GYP domain-containing protein [Nitrospirota bacterium]
MRSVVNPDCRKQKTTLFQNKADLTSMIEEYAKDWQLFINTLRYPAAIIDIECNIVAANKEMSVLFGENINSTHTKCYQVFHGADMPVENCPMVKAEKSFTHEEAEIYEPSLGKFLRVMIDPIIADKRLIGAIHYALDITDQKMAEENSIDLVEIYANSINELKASELRAQKGRDAFLNMLEDISESYKELENLFLRFILVMVNALDAKSPWTKGHSERVSMYAEQIAKEMLMDADEIKNIRLAGLLHDIGKLGIYDYLLDKPGKLTKEEFNIVKKHPAQGASILKDITQLREIIPFIKYHHEKLDGNGYPNKLKGKKIPLGAKILHVADSFDSMTSDRPYRPAPGIEYALSELEKHKGPQFDNDVVDAFLSVLEKSYIESANLL